MSENLKWHESMFMMMHNNPTEKVNAEYVNDIKAYLKNPVAPCDKKQSLKLIKQFAKKILQIFGMNLLTHTYRQLPKAL